MPHLPRSIRAVAITQVRRLWQTNQMTVAQEHYRTAATQLIMVAALSLRLRLREDGRHAGCCVAGDLHEIGIRMVTDFFEMDGWNTYYLGASTPAQAVVDTVVQHQAQVLAMSATIPGTEAGASISLRLERTAACFSFARVPGRTALFHRVHLQFETTIESYCHKDLR